MATILARTRTKFAPTVGSDRSCKMNEVSNATNQKRKKKTVPKRLRRWFLSVGGSGKKKEFLPSPPSFNQKRKTSEGNSGNHDDNQIAVRSSSPTMLADATVETYHSTRPVDESASDDYDDTEILALRLADSFSTPDRLRGSTVLPQVQVAEDDISSVSILSSDPRRIAVVMQQQQLELEIPVMVYVPDQNCASLQSTEATSGSIHGENPMTEQQPQDPAPQHSAIRTDRPLDLSSVEGMVSKPISELDPELRARLQAIQQLSSMMGASHPDVRLSMKYTSRLLYKRGDFLGAQVLQNYIQNVHREIER